MIAHFHRWSPALTGLVLILCTLTLGAAQPTQYGYRIITERAHSEQLFTQGLLLSGDTFYESSGRYGRSRLVSYPRQDTDDGFIQERSLPRRYFAEGLTELGDRLYLLTWRENTLMVFAKSDFELLESHHYTGEGWGLTDNGEQLIRSDGSHRLFFHDPKDFALLRTVEVLDRGQPVKKLNELEYIDGRVWANIWHDSRLVEIDPDSGQVKGYVDLRALVKSTAPKASQSVLNGIAWDAEQKGLWVTGKNWPTLFLIRLTPESTPDTKKPH